MSLREALIVTCGYLRQNIVEDVWADIFDVDQSTVSRYIAFLTPLVEQATREDRPTWEEAAEATRDAVALVDGSLWPYWSWDGQDRLWAGKYKTTGHGSLIVTNLQGRITFVSDPVTGNQHDMAKLAESDVEEVLRRREESSATKDSSARTSSPPPSGSRQAATSWNGRRSGTVR